MTAPNQQQTDDWNGPLGARWLANHEWLDQIMAGFSDEAMKAAAARPGEAVLDVGCGPGTTTFELARRVLPGGSVLGVDVSQPLVARARERAGDVAVDFLVADASSHPFAPASFDLLFSRFGVMFFDDPTRAFTHLRRALKSGGRLAFVCWRSTAENPWYMAPLEAARQVLPPQPPADPFAPGPFAFADGARVERILSDAGFSRIVLTPFDGTMITGQGETRDAVIDDVVNQSLRTGPTARLLGEQPDDVRARALESIRRAMAARATAEGLSLPGSVWIVRAAA